MSERYVLNGRAFVPIEVSTAERISWLLKRTRQAGLHEVVKGADETPDSFARRLIDELHLKGDVYDMLGACMVPEGTDDLDWTPELALETGRHLRKTHDPKELEVQFGLVGASLVGFFVSGLISPVTSPRSSGGDQPDVDPAAIAASSTMTSGTTSSERLPTTTSDGLER